MDRLKTKVWISLQFNIGTIGSIHQPTAKSETAKAIIPIKLIITNKNIESYFTVPSVYH